MFELFWARWKIFIVSSWSIDRLVRISFCMVKWTVENLHIPWFLRTAELVHQRCQKNEDILQQKAYSWPIWFLWISWGMILWTSEIQLKSKWQFFGVVNKWGYSLFSLKLATITQTAAIIAANPSTKPTKIQMRAPLASMQPPLNAESPFIYGWERKILCCIRSQIFWLELITNLRLGDWIHHNQAYRSHDA